MKLQGCKFIFSLCSREYIRKVEIKVFHYGVIPYAWLYIIIELSKYMHVLLYYCHLIWLDLNDLKEIFTQGA